jgi:uncharacterized membrane protein YoaK (UPF0700 family)
MSYLGRTLVVLGVVPIATGLYGVLTGSGGIPGGDAADANVESELRFLYALWVAYGVAVIYVGLRAAESRVAVRSIAAVLFAAGVARAIAWIAEGRPDTVFVVLMVLELAIPPLLVAWQGRLLRTRG